MLSPLLKIVPDRFIDNAMSQLVVVLLDVALVKLLLAVELVVFVKFSVVVELLTVTFSMVSLATVELSNVDESLTETFDELE
jgi:hypothetical protein